MRARPVLVAWSGGKDCALALREALADPAAEVRGLLTTVTEDYDRISMHGVRRSLLHEQADALNLPLVEVGIPPGCSNEVYEERMGAALREQREAGIRGVVFGDIFLEDVRRYRERQLDPLGLEPLFPLWRTDTAALARRFIDEGYEAILCVIDPDRLDPTFVGRAFDDRLLADLPADVDPCGENGEFHTFTHAGPLLARRVHVERGELVERDGFWFCELRPATFDRNPGNGR